MFHVYYCLKVLFWYDCSKVFERNLVCTVFYFNRCHSVIYSCDAEMDFQHIYLSRAEMIPLVTRVTRIKKIIEANYVMLKS